MYLSILKLQVRYYFYDVKSKFSEMMHIMLCLLCS